jgi:GT2 family glycosyltransferase
MISMGDQRVRPWVYIALSAAARRLRSRSLRAFAGALMRRGLRNLTARIAADVRRGGPALVLRKFRQQRALQSELKFQDMRPAPASVSEDFALDAISGLPQPQFSRFMNAWHGHPAIVALTEGCARRSLDYSIVVSPHPEDGLDRLGRSLSLVRHLACRNEMAVRVIVHVPSEDEASRARALEENEPPVDVIIARSCAEIREHLAATEGPRHLVQFLVSGDLICPVLAEVLARCKMSDFDLILTDMYFQESEHSVQLVLLPGVNPIHALNVDYFLSRAIMRRDLAIEALADLPAFDVHALTVAALGRCTGPGARARAHHIAFPMLCISETRHSIQRRRVHALERVSPLRLRFEPSGAATSKQSSQHRVSVVVCTKDNGFLLEQLVEGLWRDHAGRLAEIIVVSNRTTNPCALAIHQRLATEGRIKLVSYDASFSFSAQSNLGAAAASGEVLLFLNDDIVPVNKSWLGELIAPLEEPRIGVVGPLLLYPDQRVQHAGLFLGFNNLAGHTLRGVRLPDGDHGFMAVAPRQVMAVTGAALCMRRADFETLNGFDGNLFALYIQDVDLCLRAHFSGLAVVYNPRAILLHMESTSVKETLADPWMSQRRAMEHAAFLRRWGDVLAKDEFHNQNFSRAAEDLRRIVSSVSLQG